MVVDNAMAAIGAHPEQYRLVYREVRRAVLPDFPYALYFVERHELVHILACVHGRRHPHRWQARLREL